MPLLSADKLSCQARQGFVSVCSVSSEMPVSNLFESPPCFVLIEMKKSPPQPRRTPTQSRSKTLVNAIIQACQQILEQEGTENLTTNRIAEVAGVNIGSLYQYFPNKEAILANLFTENLAADIDQLSVEVSERVALQLHVSLRHTIREIIHVKAELLRHFYQRYGEFYRTYHAFLDFSASIDAQVSSAYERPAWDDFLPILFDIYRDKIVPDDLELAGFVITRQMESLLIAALEQNPDWLADEAYLQQIEHTIINYLTCSPA